jgi:putative oxidoreductase
MTRLAYTNSLFFLRLISGGLLALHGLQHLFGILTQSRPSVPFSLLWSAGVLELVGGVLIAAGLLTRPTAFLLSGEMAVAYFLAHAKNGFWPVSNGGELAVLYCFIFLFLAAAGPGAFSLDGAIGSERAARPQLVQESANSRL